MPKKMSPRPLHLPISRACNNRCVFCAVARDLDGRSVQPSVLRERIDGAAARGIRQVVFTGGEPTLSRQLVSAISYARGLGLTTALTTNGRQLSDLERVGRMAASGLEAVHISVHGATAETHNHLTGGDPVAFEQVQRALELCAQHFDLTLRTVLTTHNRPELSALVDRAAALGARFDLRRLEQPGPLDLPADEAIDALEQTLAYALEIGVDMSWHGFARDRHTLVARTTQPATPATEALFAAGERTPAMLAGLHPRPGWVAREADRRRCSPAQLAWELAATGTPLADHPLPELPPAAGPFHVLCLGTADPWLELSVLPGLAHALGQRGAEVTLHSVWSAPFQPHTLEPGRLDRLRRLARRGASDPFSETPDTTALLAGLDLSRGTTVVANAAAAQGLTAAAVHVLDHRPLEGFKGSVPGHRLVSPLPSMAALYRLAGVELQQVQWRGMPVHLGHLAEAPRSPHPLILADPLLGRTAVEAAIAGVGARVLGPPTTLLQMRARPARLAAAPVLYAPCRAKAHRCPDPLWLSVAAASGVPLVAAAVPGLTDLVDHGHTGLLYDPARPGDGLDAVRAVLEDPTLRARLSAGARERFADASTEAWATSLLEGPGPRVRWRHGRAGGW